MREYFVRIFLAGVLVTSAGDVYAVSSAARKGKGPGSAELLAKAKQAEPKKYQEFMSQGGKIADTSDGRSFYLLLSPSPDAPIIVTLHGHGAWAFADYSAWAQELTKRGYGLLALQWWFGQGEGPDDYYRPKELYRVIESALRKEGLTKRKLLLHGFSRGSANIYGVAALDHRSKNKFFPLIIANAGGEADDFPVNQEINRGRFGPLPFAGTHWILFCGGQDPNPDRDGCSGMVRTKIWIKYYGGTVDLFIQDPSAGHGGFHRNPANVAQAMSFFERFKP